MILLRKSQKRVKSSGIFYILYIRIYTCIVNRIFDYID